MPTLLIGLTFMIIGYGGAVWALPWVLEPILAWECTEPEPSETCLTPMRTMGHMWSDKGNMEKAKFWYGLPAESGDPSAMFHLAWTYEQAARKDDEAGLKPTEARRGDGGAPAQGAPGETRQPADSSNIDMAKKWYQKSADLGFAPSMNNLGQIYLYGVGGHTDRHRVFEYHMAAARAGNPVARWNVSVAYLMGNGIKADRAEAAKWKTWTRRAEITADLTEPTYSRTVLFGSALPDWKRRRLLANSEHGGSATVNVTPMKADPSLPTFRDVANKLPNQRTVRKEQPTDAAPSLPNLPDAAGKARNR